jgi:hypothetical protein
VNVPALWASGTPSRVRVDVGSTRPRTVTASQTPPASSSGGTPMAGGVLSTVKRRWNFEFPMPGRGTDRTTSCLPSARVPGCQSTLDWLTVYAFSDTLTPSSSRVLRSISLAGFTEKATVRSARVADVRVAPSAKPSTVTSTLVRLRMAFRP